jgi:tryptophan-rich sensory protein
MRFTAFLDPENYFPIFRKEASPRPKSKEDVVSNILSREDAKSPQKSSPTRVTTEPKDAQFLDKEKGMNHSEVLNYENKHLGNGEPNYFEALTSFKFLWKLLFVVALLLISIIICLNTTLDNSSESWYYKLYKSDWSPDGITIAIIFSFLSLLYIWCWYVVSKAAHNSFVDLFFIGFYVLNTLWFILLYKYHNLQASRILSSIIIGYAAVMLLYCAYFLKIGSVSLYIFLMLGWWIALTVYSYQLQDLTKEYKALGLINDPKSSLYKRKMKMELMEGIKITASGEKVEFNPDDQE